VFRAGAIPLLILAVFVCSCASGIGVRVRELSAGDPASEGFVLIGETLTLPSGRLPLYCGPEALSAVLDHHGRRIDVEVLALDIFDARRGGTIPHNMVRRASREGFDAEARRGSIGALKEAVESGVPPIIEIEVEEGAHHYFVVVGYNEERRVVICLDYNGTKRVIGYDRLEERWKPVDHMMILVRRGAAEQAVELGGKLYNAGRYKEAAKRFRRAIEIRPDHAGAHVGLGNCLRALGKNGEARAAYEKALEHAPYDAMALNNLADLLLETEQEPGKAEEMASRAVDSFRASLERTRREAVKEANPRHRKLLRREERRQQIRLAFALDTLAKARSANGHHVLAAAAWQASLDHLPLDFHDHRARRMYRLGLANRAMGMGSVARDWLRKALEEARDEDLRARIEEELE
jgi:thioredoxin-like negative regulator of GroEL